MKRYTRYFFSDGTSTKGGYVEGRDEKELNSKLAAIRRDSVGKLSPRVACTNPTGGRERQKLITDVQFERVE